VSVVVALALVASLWSMLERRRRCAGGLELEAVVLVGAAWLGGVGVGSTLLAVLGRFDAATTSAVAAIAAVAAWPWGRDRALRRASVGRGVGVAIVVLLVGVALRWPPHEHALAGRDQGTYVLRAQHTLRTGRLHAIDPVLAAAGRQAGQRAGPADLRGLYRTGDEPWRRDRYEAAYRPGFYLADLDTGRVQPQFFHLHPMLMATAGLVLGPAQVVAVVPLYAVLSLLAVWAVARRLWPRGPWAPLCAGLWAVAPLAVWVQRTALTEGPAAVMTMAGVLAVLRARDGEPGQLPTAAWLLGSIAWIRGNGWLAAPVMLAALWLVPRAAPAGAREGRRASLVYAATFGAAVLVHAPTTFPYLHDELLRQLPLATPPTPWGIALTACAGLGVWLVIDELRVRVRLAERGAAVIFGAGPWVLAAGLVLVVVAYLAGRVEPLGPPWSRLDPVVPLVGAPALGLAAIGLRRAVRAWPRAPTAAHAWLLGLLGVVVATAGLYAQRNLPQLGLYYYGRYLVPELLPAIVLLAVEGLRGVHAVVAGPRTSRARRALAAGLSAAGGGWLAWSMAGVLVTHPVTRLHEFAGAGRVVDHLASQLPPGAVVIAGGEGWHHGHTWNQVGGALAMGHGVTVLPYETREAAYASLYELLVARPAATGEPAPPVFLLINEATKHHTRRPDDEDGVARPVAAVDELLPPPFVARRISLVEMLLDRLTPTSEGPPTRVTRDGLRMALLHVEVDPARAGQVEAWRIEARAGQWIAAGPPGLQLAGGAPGDGAPCLGDAPLVVTLPDDGGAGRGPVSVVLVSTAGTPALTPRWRVEIDGDAVVLDPPRLPVRVRDTLGPIALPTRPRTIVVRGAEVEVPDARCPHGGLAEVRLLGPEAPMLARATLGSDGPAPVVEAVTFAPAQTLGHPPQPVAWVSGRGLSRYRRGLPPDVELRGLSLVVEPDRPLPLPSAALPDGGRWPLDLVVTLTGAALGPSARLWITIDGEALPPIDPPDAREGSWQSPPLRWQPSAPAATLVVELRDAGPGEHVLLRDIGLFSRAPPHAGRLSLE
jgi:hypothetical protein